MALAKVVCFLLGHQSVAIGYWNGIPVVRCRRCHQIRHVYLGHLAR